MRSRRGLNDASLRFEPETSEALGFGFRCGFLGLLHMEIVQERLEREYDSPHHHGPDRRLRGLTTGGEVPGSTTRRASRRKTPSPRTREPIIEVDILVPQEYVGNVITLCVERCGLQKRLSSGHQVALSYELPMSEMVLDFFDRLKSVNARVRIPRLCLPAFQSARGGQARCLDHGFCRCPVLDRAPCRAQRRGRELAGR